MLTKREKEVLNLVLMAKTNKQIAKDLNISSDTVNAHLDHIFTKYEVHSRIELIIKLYKNNLI